MSESSTETPAPETPAEGTTPTTPETPSPETPPEGETPEPKVYDEATVKDLRKESAGYRTRLRETETTLTTVQAELTQAKENIPALESRAREAEALVTRYKVALDAGLPANLADRLRGDDEETLKADAQALKAMLGTHAPVLDLDQGNRTPLPATKPSVNEALRVLAKGQ